VLNAPNGATEYVWNPASIAAGTTVLFAMSDAQNRTGGVSQIMVAGSTTDTSCLNANSPSVTQQSTQTSLSTSSSSASSKPSATASGSSKISITTLIAAIAGGLIFLGVLAALGAFIFRRRRKSSRRRTANFEVDGKLSKLSAVPSPGVNASARWLSRLTITYTCARRGGGLLSYTSCYWRTIRDATFGELDCSSQ
jgi:hypothetical protein